MKISKAKRGWRRHTISTQEKKEVETRTWYDDSKFDSQLCLECWKNNHRTTEEEGFEV